MGSDIQPGDLFEDVEIVELTNAEYHSAPWDSVSTSRLKVFWDDHYDFFCQYISKELERKETDALVFGRVVHEVILERQGTVDETNYSVGTLGVFRPCGVPRRDPDIQRHHEDLWIVSSPEPAVVRRSSMWGDLEGGRHWGLSPDRGGQVETAICGFADMVRDGDSFRHIPESALSASGRKAGKVWEQWEADHAGEVLCSPAEWQKILWMRNRLRHHGAAYRRLFCGGQPEVSIVGKCVETGIEVRTRLDFVADFGDVVAITDLKTSRDATQRAWNKQCVEDLLHLQAVIQIGLASHVYDKRLSFAFATVDKAAPFRPEVYQLEPELIECGVEDYQKIIRKFDRCRTTGVWYEEDYGQIKTLSVPTWRMPKFQETY